MSSGSVKRIQVPLAENPRQEVENIAEQECRTVPVQSAMLIELGLAAYKQGYTIKNGQLKRLQVKAA